LENTQLKDEVIGKDAEHNAKVTRLFEKVENAREEQDWTEHELAELKAKKEEVTQLQEARLANAQQKLAGMKDDKKVAEANMLQKVEEQENEHAADLEDMRQQLSFATEAKRIESARLEDTRRELAACEERHARVVKELNAKLKLAYGGCAGSDDGAEEVKLDIIEQLRQAEQERHLLRNEKESLKVYWQGLLEHEQLQHLADVARLEKLEESLQMEKETNVRLGESLAESERQLDEALQAKDQAEAVAKAQLLEAAEKEISNRTGFTGVFSWVRCPARASSSTTATARFSAGGNSGADANLPSLQAAVWQMINAMQGVTALLCNSETLKITDATKKACALWGSASLRGCTLASLIFDDLTASWLRREVSDSSIPVGESGDAGFTVRGIGCIEFRNKLGSTFDSSVLCARLPPEVSPPKAPLLLLVVEPMDGEQMQERKKTHTPALSNSQWPHKGSFRTEPSSGVQSIVSDDITANDSVSNINQ